VVRKVRAAEPEPDCLALFLEVNGSANGAYTYDLWFGHKSQIRPGDARQLEAEIEIVVVEPSIERVRGAVLDVNEIAGEEGLVVINANTPASPAVRGDVTGPVAERVLEAVSYTHLDVYKRQEGSDGSADEALETRGPGSLSDADNVVTRPAGVGDYRWIGDAAALDSLVGELVSYDAYALDTEFHRERTYFPQLALIQLAWRGGIALVDPLAIDVSPLARVLEGPGLAVVHAAEQDLEVLEQACGTVPSRLFDTQIAAGFLGQVSPSLVNLVERILGVRLLKGDQLTDWTRRPLSAGQLAYAAGDVAYLLELRQRIGERLEEMGRMQWATEEFAILLSRDRSSTEPEEAWWRLPRSRQLRGGARGVARCV